MKGAELRHLDENEANFVTNEIECLGFVAMQKESLQATYSNIREIVEQQQSVFETFWNRAIPDACVVSMWMVYFVSLSLGLNPQNNVKLIHTPLV
jgi:hypothetical protein